MTLSGAGRRLKGAVFERAAASALADEGFPEACRNIERRHDEGDLFPLRIAAECSVGIECKNHKSLSLGTWIDQAKEVAARMGCEWAAVIVKRKLIFDPKRSFVVMELKDWAAAMRRLRELEDRAA